MKEGLTVNATQRSELTEIWRALIAMQTQDCMVPAEYRSILRAANAVGRALDVLPGGPAVEAPFPPITGLLGPK